MLLFADCLVLALWANCSTHDHHFSNMVKPTWIEDCTPAGDDGSPQSLFLRSYVRMVSPPGSQMKAHLFASSFTGGPSK